MTLKIIFAYYCQGCKTIFCLGCYFDILKFGNNVKGFDIVLPLSHSLIFKSIFSTFSNNLEYYIYSPKVGQQRHL